MTGFTTPGAILGIDSEVLQKSQAARFARVRKRLPASDFYTQFTASVSSSVMTVTAIAQGGNLNFGQQISGANITDGTTIGTQITGTTGSTGTYNVSGTVTAASGTVTAGALSDERSRIARNGAGIYDQGEELAVVGQSGYRVWFLATGLGSNAANAAGSHAKNAVLPGGRKLLLIAETNTVTDVPVSGVAATGGNPNDWQVDDGAALAWFNNAGTWVPSALWTAPNAPVTLTGATTLNALTHGNRLIIYNSSSAANQTLSTGAAGGWAIGDSFDLLQQGVGAPTVIAGAATLTVPANALVTPAAQGQIITFVYTATDTFTAASLSGGGVTTASVVSANGFAGSVANPTTTPAITISTSVTGLLKGNGTAVSAAASGTDYGPPTSALATGLVKSTTSTGAHTIAAAGTDYGPPTSGLATGILKNTTGTGAHTIAASGTDYGPPTSALATGILKSTTTTGAHTIAVAADFPTLNQATTGNAATATALATARNINGVAFDGSANITVADATKLPLAGGALTGAVTSSSTISATGGFTGNLTGNASGTAANVTGVVAIANGGTNGISTALQLNALAAAVNSQGYMNPAGLEGMRFVGTSTPDMRGLVVNTDFSSTGRITYTNGDSINRLALGFDSGITSGGSAGQDPTQTSTQIYRATVETGASSVARLTAGGVDEWYVNVNSGTVITDPIGVVIPPGTFTALVFTRVARPPSGAAAAAVSGGILTASTTYYYTLTTVDLGGAESGPVTEFSAATGASVTLAIKLTWTKPTNGVSINIYRSAASGGTKQLLSTVSARRQSFVDLGYDDQVTTQNPPAANPTLRCMSRALATGESMNTQTYNSGSGLDTTGTAGAITGTAGPTTQFPFGASFVLANKGSKLTHMSLGDSIPFGAGVPLSTFTNKIQGQYSNFFTAACEATGTNGPNSSCNSSVSSSSIFTMFDGTKTWAARLKKMPFADVIHSNLGINDIGSAQTWQQLATNHLKLAAIVVGMGRTYIPSTLSPRVASTDNCLTIGNQTQDTNTAVRINYNNWLRNGCRTSSGTPVLSGGTTNTALIATYFEMANLFEVNASNVLTQDGGYWRVPSAAETTGLVASGSPTTTSLAVGSATYTASSSTVLGQSTKVIKVTSGAANGQVAACSTNTTTTLTLLANGSTAITSIALAGLTTALTAGDTFDIWKPYSLDGLHYAPAGHAVAATAFRTFLDTL